VDFQRDFSCQVPDVCGKFHQNPWKFATLRARTTHTQKCRTLDTRHRTQQMILCSLQCCYAHHWTDNNFVADPNMRVRACTHKSVSNIGHQTSNIGHRTYDIGHSRWFYILSNAAIHSIGQTVISWPNRLRLCSGGPQHGRHGSTGSAPKIRVE